MKRIRRRRLTRAAVARRALTAANHEWAVDFANDVTDRGRRIRVLSAMDAFTRVMARRGPPSALRSRNGPELTWPGRAESRTRPHSARTSHAKRPCGMLPWVPARRVPKSKLVRKAVGRPPQDQCLARALQHTQTAFAARLTDSRTISKQSGERSLPSPSSDRATAVPRNGPTMTPKELWDVV